MALSPIGNVTYINQNSQLGSIQHANNMHKADFTLATNMQNFVDKMKAVQEVSPAPQVEAIDPEKDENKKRDFQEKQKKQQEQEKTEYVVEDEDFIPDKTHLLDIRA